MNSKSTIKLRSRSTNNNIKTNNKKRKKILKKSPKTIDYNKVVEKYGNFLETSLNTSDNTQSNKNNNNEKGNNDSYYDYIIDNIYNDNIRDNNKKYKYSIIKDNNNDDSMYHLTFKQKLKNISSTDNDSNDISEIKYEKSIPLSISNKKDKVNNYYNPNIMYNIFSSQLKQNKSNKANTSYKNESNEKIIDKLDINIKNNNSYNNIRTDLSKEKQNKNKNNNIRLDKDNNNNTNIINKSNNISKEEKDEVNMKFKEKVKLLLNLCRKYANKFNKLFPLCEASLISEKSNINNIINHNSLKELKSAIIQYNNMIFSDGVTKIFDLDNNSNNNIPLNNLK